MDEATIAAKGAAPLKPHLDRIAAVKDKGELAELFATRSAIPRRSAVAIFPDLAEPTRYGVYAGQGGLGMPNRDYYLLEGAKYDAYRAAYKAYLTKLQQLAGIADAAAKADRIFALETAIAKVHWKPEDSRDISKIYNPMDRAKLNGFAPQLQWDRALAKAGLGDVKTVVVTETSAVQEIAKLVEARRSTRGRTIWPSTSSAAMRPTCPRTSTRRGSTSIRRPCATSPTSATASDGGWKEAKCVL